MKVTLMIAMALSAAGCTTAISHSGDREDAEYLRDSDRIEAFEGFQRLRNACRQAGGVVYMPRGSSGRFSPTAFEMRNASCDRRPRAGLVR